MNKVNRNKRIGHWTVGGAILAASASLLGCQHVAPQPIGEELYKNAPDPSDVTSAWPTPRPPTQRRRGRDAPRLTHFDGSSINSGSERPASST